MFAEYKTHVNVMKIITKKNTQIAFVLQNKRYIDIHMNVTDTNV